MSELHPGEAKFDAINYIMTSRNWASEVLTEVASLCDVGMYPQRTSAFDLGRAIGRAVINCNEDNAYDEVKRGIDHYLSQK